MGNDALKHSTTHQISYPIRHGLIEVRLRLALMLRRGDRPKSFYGDLTLCGCARRTFVTMAGGLLCCLENRMPACVGNLEGCLPFATALARVLPLP